MTLWQRIKSWFTKPEPFDPETTYPSMSTSIPSDMFVPGESQRINAPPDDQPCPHPPTH